MTRPNTTITSQVLHDFEWVDHPDQLNKVIESIGQSTLVAVDTEFDRSTTFFPRLGLLQFKTSSGCYLVDPVAAGMSDRLNELFQMEEVEYCFHSCSEDLEVLLAQGVNLPVRLFDTQVAAAFLGMGNQLAYKKLVLELEGHELPKEETRSDWLARPLSHTQLDYAAADVVYLADIAKKLQFQLQQQQRLHWVREECRVMVLRAEEPVVIEEYYQNFGQSWQLKPRELLIFKKLVTWREEEARRIDQPRSSIFRDHDAFVIARKKPRNRHVLAKLQEIKGRTLRQFGEQILDIVEEALQVDESELPTRLSKPLPREAATVSDQIKAWVAEIAKEIQMPGEVLMKKKLIKELMVAYGQHVVNDEEIQLPLELEGWRRSVIVEPLLERLQQYQTELAKWYLAMSPAKSR